MKLAASGLGEDLYAAVDGVGVVLCGVGVLVDADLANGVFRRQLSTAEAVDLKVGCAAAGESVELVGKLAGVDREPIDIFAAEDDLVAVVPRVSIGGGLCRDIDLLDLGSDGEVDVECTSFVGLELDCALEGREAVVRDGNGRYAAGMAVKA